MGWVLLSKLFRCKIISKLVESVEEHCIQILLYKWNIGLFARASRGFHEDLNYFEKSKNVVLLSWLNLQTMDKSISQAAEMLVGAKLKRVSGIPNFETLHRYFCYSF